MTQATLGGIRNENVRQVQDEVDNLKELSDHRISSQIHKTNPCAVLV